MKCNLFVGLLAICAAGLLAAPASADVKLPHLFGDHMVLQQKTEAPVWGWADAGEEVTVTLGDAKAIAKAGDDGKWMTKLKTPAAGGPFELKVKGKNEITFKDVLVGEVWLASGQSNMEWTVANSLNAADEAKAADHPQIRMIKVAKKPSDKPLDDFAGDWKVCTPQNVPQFSACGYFFARKLHEELGVPVGIINSSWGGTICEAWACHESLEHDADFKPILDRAAQFKPDQPNQAAVLFNGMINPLLPYAIEGAIWYQGESNHGRAAQYAKLFPTMIKDWREHFHRGDFPFLFVQLAPYKYGNEDPRILAELWEAQTKTLSLPNTGMAVTTDIGDVTNIHPKNKQEVGRRLALWALANTYGKQELVYSGPLYDSMQVDGNKIRLKFQHVDGGLVAEGGKPLSYFQIAGEDQKFVDATAKIDGDTVVVGSDEVAKPVAVRFAWNKIAEPNFFNKAGLPASPFRTDDFPLLTKDAK
jgi:sialate O-acetylesterase